MASRKKSSGTRKGTRAPFVDRFSAKITKLKTWIEKTGPRFASAPKQDITESLGAINDSLDAINEAIPKLNGWAPPTRSPAFAVGDTVVFKKDRAAKLIKEGAYSADELEGGHEIVAVVGRRVKIDLGLFQSLFVTKSAE